MNKTDAPYVEGAVDSGDILEESVKTRETHKKHNSAFPQPHTKFAPVRLRQGWLRQGRQGQGQEQGQGQARAPRCPCVDA